MSASLLFLALTAVTNNLDTAPQWQSDYLAAAKVTEKTQRPLAVFFGKGTDGYKQVVTSKQLDSETQKLLREQFVPVYIDITTEAGKKWAPRFKITSGQGLVVSDSTGESMAFRHDGTLSGSDLARYLKRYSKAREVTRTETASSSRTSYYSGPSSSSSGSRVIYSSPSYSGYSGGYSGGSFGGFSGGGFSGGVSSGNC